MVRYLENLVLIFFIYSFAGWFMESFGGIFKEKKFINRGFLIGPYCPVYGCGVVGITVLLSKYQNDIYALFILSTVICGSLEYFTSYIMEKLFNARWWDYHNRKFNINGRICLETLIPFGVAGTTIVCIINPALYNFFNHFSDMTLHIITVILILLFIIDFIISFCIISSFKGATYSKKDNTEEISNKVREKTEEISNNLKDRTEDTLMQLESNAIVFRRNLKVRRLKIERKVKYTGKRIQKTAITPIKELSVEIKEKTSNIKNAIGDRKDKLDEQLKIKQKEISNQIIENFREKSILSKRLMDAFPRLSIKFNKKDDDELQK